MKYKVGDKVKIKSWEQMAEELLLGFPSSLAEKWDDLMELQKGCEANESE